MLFVILALFFGVIFVRVTPPLWAPDEAAHFFRAYQVSTHGFSGTQISIKGEKHVGIYVPESFDKLQKLVKSDIEDNGITPRHQVDDLDTYARIDEKPVSRQRVVPTTTGVTIYPAFTYTAPALGILIARLFDPTTMTMLFSARLATLILYVALVAGALYYLRNSSMKWAVFVIALLPTSVFQASAVSADSLVLGLSLLFVAMILGTFLGETKLSHRKIIVLTIVPIILTAVKPSYAPLSVVLCTVLLKKYSLNTLKNAYIKYAIPIIAFITAIACLLLPRQIISSGIEGLSSVSLTGQLHFIFDHPLHYIHSLLYSISWQDWFSQTIGIFGASFVFVPMIVIHLLIMLLGVTILVATPKEAEDSIGYAPIRGLIYMGVALFTSLLVVTTLYLTWTPVGALNIEGVQGRYFLPIVLFFMLGLRMLLRTRLLVSEKKLRIMYVFVMTFSLAASLAWYYKILY